DNDVNHIGNCLRCMRTLDTIRAELRERAQTGFQGMFEDDARDAGRARSVLLREHSGTLRRISVRIGGLAAAAAIVATVWLLWSSTGGGPALATDLREIAFARPIPFEGTWVDLNDPAAVSEVESVVEAARVELAEALSADPPPQPTWLPWTQLYRNLEALGRWEEALEEMERFEAYARQLDQKTERYTMYYTVLRDLGRLHASLGDYDTALRFHQDAYETALDYQEWRWRAIQASDPAGLTRVEALAGAVTPFLWDLSRMAAARGERDAAWSYHNQAGDLLLGSFRQECARRELDITYVEALLADRAAGDPARVRMIELYELCATVDADAGPNPDDRMASFMSKAREHLMFKARLFRLDRNVDAATESLDLGRSLRDFPFADESRLDFNEPMERVRLAIARGDFSAALEAADDALRNSGSRGWEGRPTHPRIGVIARAELQLLRGVALAGLDKNDPEALRLLNEARDTIEKTAASLPKAKRKHFLNRFGHWNQVIDELPGEEP
ncbi:MAG: tetratricopeptide repeat protein, partial [bacterium]